MHVLNTFLGGAELSLGPESMATGVCKALVFLSEPHWRLKQGSQGALFWKSVEASPHCQ